MLLQCWVAHAGNGWAWTLESVVGVSIRYKGTTDDPSDRCPTIIIIITITITITINSSSISWLSLTVSQSHDLSKASPSLQLLKVHYHGAPIRRPATRQLPGVLTRQDEVLQG